MNDKEKILKLAKLLSEAIGLIRDNECYAYDPNSIGRDNVSHYLETQMQTILDSTLTTKEI